MAIKKDDSLSTGDEVVLRIDNGDLAAIKKIQEAWKLKDLESAVIFAVGVLRTALDTKKVLVGRQGIDEPVAVNPGEQLLLTTEDTDNGTEKSS